MQALFVCLDKMQDTGPQRGPIWTPGQWRCGDRCATGRRFAARGQIGVARWTARRRACASPGPIDGLRPWARGPIGPSESS